MTHSSTPRPTHGTTPHRFPSPSPSPVSTHAPPSRRRVVEVGSPAAPLMAPWEHLRVVGMVPPPASVDLGAAVPLFAADNHPAVPAPLRGAHILGPGLQGGVSARVWWPEGAPDTAASRFTREPPRAARPGAPAAPAKIAADGPPVDDWTPREGCMVAVVRPNTWRRLRQLGVSPPWVFSPIGVIPGGDCERRCRVALVDRSVFHAWRRTLGWGILATIRAALRAEAAGTAPPTGTEVFSYQRLAFDVLPQYTLDRATVKALTLLTARDDAARDRARASLMVRRTEDEVVFLTGAARAWLDSPVGSPVVPPGLDRLPASIGARRVPHAEVVAGAAGGFDDGGYDTHD